MVNADLSARRTAARAALDDYLSADSLDMLGRAMWAGRLANELKSVLDELDRTDPGGTADDNRR